MMFMEHTCCGGLLRRRLPCVCGRRGAKPRRDLLSAEAKMSWDPAVRDFPGPRPPWVPTSMGKQDNLPCWPETDEQREEPPVRPSIPLHSLSWGTYHVPEKRIESDGEDCSHKVGF